MSYTVSTLLQMTLVLTTFFGYIVDDVVFIAGFVMRKQEGAPIICSCILFHLIGKHLTFI
jgi:hypothetical protein